MKKGIFTLVFSLFVTMIALAQNSETKAIEATIHAFAQAGDANDANKLDQLLDANFRIVMNQLFGSKEVAILPKSAYISKIKSKEWGGDSRKVDIQSLAVNGKSATAVVSLKGNKATFVSTLHLINDANGTWKLISDTPTVL